MTDVAYRCSSPSPKGATLTAITAMAKMAIKVIGEWRHRYRSRRELALYSYHERSDLSFAADVEAEISKPFWSE
jgi:uncharacterized protein YjiS (DUF1127 family)